MINCFLVKLVQYMIRELKSDKIEMISCCQSHAMNSFYLLVCYKSDCYGSDRVM